MQSTFTLIFVVDFYEPIFSKCVFKEELPFKINHMNILLRSSVYCIFLLVLLRGGLSAQTLQTLEHDEIERTYYIYVPESYTGDQSVPLLMVFHGYTSSAKNIMSYSGFNSIADKEGFIAVYPQGTRLENKTHWNVGGWTLKSSVDDVDFVDQLLDTLSNRYTIDPNRIYATGMSNGGYMSFLLACKLSSRIAAIASVTGSMTPQTFYDCAPQHPMPVLQFHGTADGTVPYQGAPLWTQSIDDVLLYWKSFNETQVSTEPTALPDLNKKDGSTVEHYRYDNPVNGIAVEHYKVLGGKHQWFGVRGNKDIQASRIIWDFLDRYALDGLRH